MKEAVIIMAGLLGTMVVIMALRTGTMAATIGDIMVDITRVDITVDITAVDIMVDIMRVDIMADIMADTVKDTTVETMAVSIGDS